MKHLFQAAILLSLFLHPPFLTGSEQCKKNTPAISVTGTRGYFALSKEGRSAPLCFSSQDFPGVLRVGGHFQADIAHVTGGAPELCVDRIPNAGEVVLIGTLGKNPVIEKLIAERRLDVSCIQGKREAFLIQAVTHPMPDVDMALIIAGSDKRGTLYGMFDLSQRIGVSPWTWWADVPIKKKSSVYVSPGLYTLGEPKVKYRGIFLNDEAPALSGWAWEKYGGFNSAFYRNVFELILRLKGNFLWPAMWGRAFYDDDPENPRLADEYGIVIGTSHHEPMMRAHDEWRRYGSGPWNYEKNDSVLRAFWREGIRRMGAYESIVTLAMRGDGDEAMSPTANISLLQKIVEDQRAILREVTGGDPVSIPQVWALYKEVQEYYDKGMRVPEDVTLLLCDDNWGNLRKLPKLSDPPRQGGYGIYYHYDFVGGPRNYKWLNTNQIERVWEQMHLAYQYGAREIWIVNVGDLKPMEFPIDFFLDYAWDPESITAGSLPEYYRAWAEEQFGPDHAGAIAGILQKYTRYNARRKPELLSPDTYSFHYREAERVTEEYQALYEQTKAIARLLPAEYQDAFYQLVLHPVEACSNLHALYFAVAQNRLYAKQKRNMTNALAEKAKILFQRDAEITRYYHVMAGGKWNHMMDQTHIGYTSWQQPDQNVMPDVDTITVPEHAEMGVAIEDSEDSWPGCEKEAELPVFDPYNKQQYTISLFNRGRSPYHYSVRSEKPWVLLSPQEGTVESEQSLAVRIDWQRAPAGTHRVPITVSGSDGSTVTVQAVIHHPVLSPKAIAGRFIEANGVISIEADHFSRAVEKAPVSWLLIPNLGRTGSAMTLLPVTMPRTGPETNGSRLEYDTYFFSTGEARVSMYLSPTLNFGYTEGLHYAVSFDDEKPKMINIHEGQNVPDWKYPPYWNEMVANAVRITVSGHQIVKAGPHVLKIWAVDPGVVLQKIVIETRGAETSTLGPPQSARGMK